MWYNYYMKALVYMATSPSNKRYIGITTKGLRERRLKHIVSAKNGSDFQFHKALRLYEDSIIWEVLEEVNSWERAQELEKYYIEKFDTFKKGYNMTLGGEGSLRHAPFLGRKHSEKTKKLMREAQLGHEVSKKTRNKISRANKGRVQSDSEILGKLRARGLREFLIIDKESGKELGVYINHSECARDFKLNRNMVSHCLNNPKKYKSHKGYIFKYREVSDG